MEPNAVVLNQIKLDPGGIVVTAKGDSADVVFESRYFTPQAAIFEDPVIGSAHCALIPFWADRLKKNKMKASQVSSRGGEIFCTLEKDRVHLKGKAVKYMEGIITLKL